MKHRIRINLEGESSSLNLLDTRFGVWVDSMSNILIADLSRHRIIKWNNSRSMTKCLRML